MLAKTAPVLASLLRQTRTCQQALCASTASTSWAAYGTEASTSLVKALESDADYQAVLQRLAKSGKLGVFDFTAAWCGPCRHIAPVYEQLSTQHPDVEFYKVDIDNPGVRESVTQLEISAVPTFKFYKGSKKVESFTGARVDLLRELLEKHGPSSGQQQ